MRDAGVGGPIRVTAYIDPYQALLKFLSHAFILKFSYGQ